jgi:hypothetical protein
MMIIYLIFQWHGDGVSMDKLGMLAELEKLAEAGAVGNGEFRLFLLLLANYDCGRQSGEIGYGDVVAALGQGFSRARLNRACRGLSALGLLEIKSPLREGSVVEEPVMVYGIPLLTRVQG